MAEKSLRIIGAIGAMALVLYILISSIISLTIVFGYVDSLSIVMLVVPIIIIIFSIEAIVMSIMLMAKKNAWIASIFLIATLLLLSFLEFVGCTIIGLAPISVIFGILCHGVAAVIVAFLILFKTNPSAVAPKKVVNFGMQPPYGQPPYYYGQSNAIAQPNAEPSKEDEKDN